jgi:hypothetical protein
MNLTGNAALPALACLLALAGCSSGDERKEAGAGAPASPATSERTPATARAESTRVRRVDPREDGLEIAMGEWALTPEAEAVRPGPVTLVIRNRGTVVHGFEIKAESGAGRRG